MSTRPLFPLFERRRWLWVAMLALPALSCVSLDKRYPEKRFYRLAVDRPESTEASLATAAVLELRTLREPVGYETRGFIYRLGAAQYESDFYHEFFSAPAGLTAHELQRWLDDSGQFAHVLAGSSFAEPDFVLEGTLNAIYGDYRESQPVAVLELRFQISQTDPTSNASIVFDEAYRAETAVDGRDPEALVHGWNEGLANVFAQLETALSEQPWLVQFSAPTDAP